MSNASPAQTGTALPAVPTESRTGLVYIITAILTASSTIAFALRLYTRCFLLKTAGADDWTMLVAQILAIVAGVATALEAYHGLGRHIQSLSMSSIRESLIFLYIAIFAYNIGLNVVKVSFLLQYRRIFPSAILRRVCYWTLAFVCVWTVIQVVLLGITCIPLEVIAPETTSWCLNTLPIWEFTSIVSLVTDFAILLIPLPCIWELPIPMRQKSALFGIFGLGFFVCVISIIRVPTLRAAASAVDPTWDNVAAALWTLTEFNAAILCSSLPILRPLFFKVSSRLTSARKTGISTAEFAEDSSGVKLRTLKSDGISDQTIEIGPQDSSEDLVTATYDEMMYGSRGRQNTAGGVRRMQSHQTATFSDADSAVELGLPSRPHD